MLENFLINYALKSNPSACSLEVTFFYHGEQNANPEKLIF